MQVHQVLVSVAYGDAVTNEALQLRNHLRREGRSEIFAHHSDLMVPEIHPFENFDAFVGGEPTIILVHYSIGHPELQRFLLQRRERLVIRYHNVTPASFFQVYDPTFARSLEDSRTALAELAPMTSFAAAVSQYNAGELHAMGFADVRVLPLVVDVARLTKLKPQPPPVPLPARSKGPVVLFVGRVSPNKGHPDLIAAFHILKTYLRPDAFLVLAGSFFQPHYKLALESYVSQLALPGVTFAGHLSDAALAAVYRRADVFLCLSAHEGFGVPLLEAMSFRVPVVTWGSSAIAETVGDGGIVLQENSPTMAAEAAHRVLGDSLLRNRLVERGTRRLTHFDAELTGRELVEQLHNLAR